MPKEPLTAVAEQFIAARDAYRDARNTQRKIIAEALTAAGFTVKSSGNAGRGLVRYMSSGQLAPPFDLSNWMWVEGQRTGVNVVITLQTLDQDPRSLNIHALIDRIGVNVYRDGDPIAPEDPLRENTTTSF